MNPNLKPIQLLPARERVAASLRKAIIGMDFKPGEQITLDAISGLLGVSITPVREAFMMLESEGLIQILPNKRVVILGITEKSVREHFQMRAALESYAAELCCREDVNLSAICAVMKESAEVIKNKDYEEYSNLNQAFHLAIWHAAGNERIEKSLSVMWNGLSIRYMESLESYSEKSYEEHIKIWDAINKRDSDAARSRMITHIERSMNDMLTNLENQTAFEE